MAGRLRRPDEDEECTNREEKRKDQGEESMRERNGNSSTRGQRMDVEMYCKWPE